MSSRKRSRKSMLKRGINSAKKTVRSVIPTLASGIGKVGETVIGTAQKTIPKARGSIRGMFGLTGKSKRRGRKSRSSRRMR